MLLNSWDDNEPKELLNLLWYHIAKYLALRGGQYRQILWRNFTAKYEPKTNLKYYQYQHALEKNKQGGLKGTFAPRISYIPPDDPNNPIKMNAVALIDRYIILRESSKVTIPEFFVQSVKKGIFYLTLAIKTR
jgi:hypothetical protein